MLMLGEPKESVGEASRGVGRLRLMLLRLSDDRPVFSNTLVEGSVSEVDGIDKDTGGSEIIVEGSETDVGGLLREILLRLSGGSRVSRDVLVEGSPMDAEGIDIETEGREMLVDGSCTDAGGICKNREMLVSRDVDMVGSDSEIEPSAVLRETVGTLTEGKPRSGEVVGTKGNDIDDTVGTDTVWDGIVGEGMLTDTVVEVKFVGNERDVGRLRLGEDKGRVGTSSVGRPAIAEVQLPV